MTRAAVVFAWTGALVFAVSLGYFLYSYLFRFGAPTPPGDWRLPALIDTALFSVFALHHSVFARTPIKAWVARTFGATMERSIYAWAASVLFIAVVALWQPVPGELYRAGGLARAAGFAVQALGVVLTFLGARVLDPLDLAGVRHVHPSSSRRARLMTSGAYGLVRHPLYFGWALLVFGAPHMTATRLVFAVVSTLYLAIAIPFEERGLVATFGPAYDDYRRRVRWRMLPFVY